MGESAIYALLLADAALLLLLGYKDLREASAHFLAVPAYLVLPAAILYLARRPEAIAMAATMTAVFAAMTLVGQLGYLDMVLAPRFGLLFLLPNPLVALALLVSGAAAALYLFYRLHLKPYLCGRRLLSNVALVRREALIESVFVLPAGVGVEELGDEELARRKREVYESAVARGEECVEALVGVPWCWVFSLGYALAVTLVLALPA